MKAIVFKHNGKIYKKTLPEFLSPELVKKQKVKLRTNENLNFVNDDDFNVDTVCFYLNVLKTKFDDFTIYQNKTLDEYDKLLSVGVKIGDDIVRNHIITGVFLNITLDELCKMKSIKHPEIHQSITQILNPDHWPLLWKTISQYCGLLNGFKIFIAEDIVRPLIVTNRINIELLDFFASIYSPIAMLYFLPALICEYSEEIIVTHSHILDLEILKLPSTNSKISKNLDIAEIHQWFLQYYWFKIRKPDFTDSIIDHITIIIERLIHHKKLDECEIIFDWLIIGSYHLEKDNTLIKKIMNRIKKIRFTKPGLIYAIKLFTKEKEWERLDLVIQRSIKFRLTYQEAKPLFQNLKQLSIQSKIVISDHMLDNYLRAKIQYLETNKWQNNFKCFELISNLIELDAWDEIIFLFKEKLFTKTDFDIVLPTILREITWYQPIDNDILNQFYANEIIDKIRYEKYHQAMMIRRIIEHWNKDDRYLLINELIQLNNNWIPVLNELIYLKLT